MDKKLCSICIDNEECNNKSQSKNMSECYSHYNQDTERLLEKLRKLKNACQKNCNDDYFYEDFMGIYGELTRFIEKCEDRCTCHICQKGPKGEKGEPGEHGCKGDKGEPGERGPKGEKGEPGERGPKGEKGDTGEQGPKGEKGDTGERGPKGDKGDTGEQGPRGEKGEQGPKGEKGEQGPKGEKGEQGPKGDKGEKGDKGDTGKQGPPGKCDCSCESVGELVENGGMEFFNTGSTIPDGWHTTTPSLVSIVNAQGRVHSGISAVNIGDGATITQEITNIKPGCFYEFSFFARSEGAKVGFAAAVDFITTGLAYTGAQINVMPEYLENSNRSFGYYRIITIAAPANVTKAVISFTVTANPNQSMDLDDVSLSVKQ